MRILGIDPGLRVTGFGVIEQSGSQLRYITSGCVRSGKGELAERLKLLLGQARGSAICAAVIAGLPVAEYTALQVKQAVVGKGHAQKEQVQHMVRRLLALPGDPSPDAADALACAICHAHGGQGMGALATAGYRMRNGRLV